MRGSPPLARGDVVLVRFPFSDLSGSKRRPGLVLVDQRGEDAILAFVTSRTAAGGDPAEPVMAPGDPEFAFTGLKTASAVRLYHLATLHRSLITVRVGRIGPRTMQTVARGLRHLFRL